MTIKEIFKEKKEKEIAIKAWVISNRGNNNVRFITINDGSTFINLQVVIKNEEAKAMDIVRIGASILVEGKVVLTPDSKQPLELIANKIKLLKNTTEDYPVQKKGISKEVLREIPHVRHRTNLFRAVMRIRSTLALEIHNFFNQKNYLYVHSPIITSNDAEGAGESFNVDSEEKNFFDKQVSLSVSGQLHAEAYANGFGGVYTFAPTFRAENSHTQKHAAEFWMLEPEIAFQDKEFAIKLSDELLKAIIKNTMKKHKSEFGFLNNFVDKNLIEKLNNFLEKGVQVITYQKAIEELKKVKTIFKEQNIEFGLDLATEHEKYIAEEIFKGPVAVVDYPKEIKAFYMKQNKDNKTVGAFDVLVPGIGELIGGSERETDYEKLLLRLKELNINHEDLKWYLDLRKWGQAQSVGFGLGFERLVMYVTGVSNIRDVLPYPRTPGTIKF